MRNATKGVPCSVSRAVELTRRRYPMKRMLLVLGAGLAFTTTLAAQEANNALDGLQGNWSLVSGVINGQKMTADEVQGVQRRFTGSRFVTTRDGKTVTEGRVTLAAGRSPQAIDVAVQDGAASVTF